MAELLFEIFCEEIPARMQVRAGEDLSKALTDGLKKAGLTATNVRVFTGPRRIVFVADVPERGEEKVEETRGPRVGSPDKAIQGFLRGLGYEDEVSLRALKMMKPEQPVVIRLMTGHSVQLQEGNKGVSYVATRSLAAPLMINVIRALIPEVIIGFTWPKSMKSGRSSHRWVRPIHSMICLFDGKVVKDLDQGFPFQQYPGVNISNITEGHRRLGIGPYEVNDFSEYKYKLEGDGHVILSHQKRKEIIIQQARKACAAKGLELVEDEGLLNEVAGLAEWPVVILGDMDPSFLELPGEVIRLSMRTHQKYFAVRDPKTGNLAPNFIVVANQAAPDGGVAIAKGNSKVLSARLADAQFFQSEDAKKSLIDYYEKLDTVVFHKKLGSIKDKAERVAALARELAPKVGADADKAEQAAKLAKCDLVTQTVVEFTSLQGQIGAQMYRRENDLPLVIPALSGDPTANAEFEDRSPLKAGMTKEWDFTASDHVDIATAIEEHYKPQGPSDNVPTNPVAVAVALADKLDTLVGFWAIDEKPTGSKDPFALRRAALGVVRIILENDVRIHLVKQIWLHLVAAISRQAPEIVNEEQLLEEMLRAGEDESVSEIITKYAVKKDREIQSFITSGRKVALGSLLTFILDRLKVYLRDKGTRHDIIDAVFANGEDDLVAIVNRVTALQSFLETSEGENLLAGYKRAANILKAEAKKGDLPTGDIGTLSQSEALVLQSGLTKAKADIEAALASESYSTAMTALSGLRGPIDAFFENVMVVSEVKTERENNLRLLGMIRDTARQIADFDKISG